MNIVINPDLAFRMEEQLHDRHRARLGDARFRVEGWREGNRVIVRFTLQNRDRSLYYPMEAGVELEAGTEQEITDALWLAADFLDHYAGQYFESSREVLLPLDWKEMRYGDRTLFARGWERNLALEEAADRWLAEHGGEAPDDGESRD